MSDPKPAESMQDPDPKKVIPVLQQCLKVPYVEINLAKKRPLLKEDARKFSADSARLPVPFCKNSSKIPRHLVQ